MPVLVPVQSIIARLMTRYCATRLGGCLLSKIHGVTTTITGHLLSWGPARLWFHAFVRVCLFDTSKGVRNPLLKTRDQADSAFGARHDETHVLEGQVENEITFCGIA